MCVKIVTLITDIYNYGFNNILKPSVHQHKLDLVVLTTDGYKGHRDKDMLLYRYIEQLAYDDIVIFTDGYDTMFLSGVEEILMKYSRFGKDLLFSAETTCWPDADLLSAYPETTSPFRYLNSGGFIGKAGFIKSCLDEHLETDSIAKYPWSNQIYWTERYLKNKDKIALDTGCEIFCTLASVVDMEIGIQYLKKEKEVDVSSNGEAFDRLKVNGSSDVEVDIRVGELRLAEYTAQKIKWFRENFYFRNERAFVIPTQSRPCHLHFNGGSKVLLKEVQDNLSQRFFSSY